MGKKSAAKYASRRKNEGIACLALLDHHWNLNHVRSTIEKWSNNCFKDATIIADFFQGPKHQRAKHDTMTPNEIDRKKTESSLTDQAGRCTWHRLKWNRSGALRQRIHLGLQLLSCQKLRNSAQQKSQTSRLKTTWQSALLPCAAFTTSNAPDPATGPNKACSSWTDGSTRNELCQSGLFNAPAIQRTLLGLDVEAFFAATCWTPEERQVSKKTEEPRRALVNTAHHQTNAVC